MKPYSLNVRRKQFDWRVKKIESGCWIWQGGKFASGYGSFSLDGKKEYAHRASYRLFNGDIEEGKIVCHTCNVKMCVNPLHLYLGTHSDNAFDKVRDEKGKFQRLTKCNHAL